jgi:hypothetical protein
MSEDRLDKALEEMKSESVTPEQLAGARGRVWEKLGISGRAVCTELAPGFRDYLEGRLAASRRLLVEDHLSRCPQCRAQLARLKGEGQVIGMPRRRASRLPLWGAWAAAAALLVAALYMGRDRIDTLLAPGGPRATVASVSGGLYRVPEGVLQTGAALAEGEVVRTGPGARARLRLADGSIIDLNERTELFVRAAWSGQAVYLQRGDIIVQAAKQHRGSLQVLTRDSVAAVKGTVFAVSAGLGGTVVSVVEGSVAVTQPGTEVLLRPGEQAASNPALAGSVQESVAWSPDAETYIALLTSFAKIEKQIAALPAPMLRTQSRLLQYLPAETFVYGAAPNLSATIRQTIALFEQQSAENPVFREWWNSSNGQELKLLVDRVQAVTPLLGDEIVFGFAATAPGMTAGVPMLFAEVQPGKRAELAGAFDAVRNQAGEVPFAYSLTDSFLAATDSQEHLQWILGHMGQGAATPFGAALAARYQRGAGLLLGIDVETLIAAETGKTETALLGAQQMKHLFLEQRAVQGVEQNEVTLTFKGPRMGMASWLASTGSGVAAEYLSGDALFAVYLSTREPRQLFEEITAQLLRSDPSSGGALAEADAKLGANFVTNLVAAFGTESAFALEGLSVTGPVWELAVLVNDPATIDTSVRKLVDVFNAGLGAEDQAKRIALTQETADGRVWTTLKSGLAPVAITWTYDRGYLVAASDRGAAARAIATRTGGSPLVWSAAFQQQLPASSGLHPSGFAWLNTKGAFQGLAALAPNATLQQLITERDPILVVFDGATEQIHSASRTQLSGLIMDMMLLKNLSQFRFGAQTATLQQGSAQPGTR